MKIIVEIKHFEASGIDTPEYYIAVINNSEFKTAVQAGTISECFAELAISIAEEEKYIGKP